MPKSKAIAELDEMPDDEFQDDLEPVKINDAALVKALNTIAAAVKSTAEKPETEGPDYTQALASIAKAIIGMGDTAREVKELRASMGGIATAIAQRSQMDLSVVAEAINRLAASNKALLSAMTAPRVLTFDANGEPNGLRIERVN